MSFVIIDGAQIELYPKFVRIIQPDKFSITIVIDTHPTVLHAALVKLGLDRQQLLSCSDTEGEMIEPLLFLVMLWRLCRHRASEEQTRVAHDVHNAIICKVSRRTE